MFKGKDEGATFSHRNFYFLKVCLRMPVAVSINDCFARRACHFLRQVLVPSKNFIASVPLTFIVLRSLVPGVRENFSRHSNLSAGT